MPFKVHHNKEEKGNEGFPVKVYFKGELAKMYGVGPRRFRDLISRYPKLKKEIGNVKQLTPKQVRLILEKLGEPGYWKD
jgi:hypothetical protein